MVVVSLKKRDGNGSSTKGNKVEYDIVTQVTVTLDLSSPYTVRRVTDLVSKQVGVDVFFLDSKCYPLLENDSTSVESFWRGTRKVLAANRAIYGKLTGQCTDLQKASVDLTGEDSDASSVGIPPTLKRPCRDSLPLAIEEKLDKIVRGVSSVERLMTLMGNLQQTFRCVLCHGTVTSPVVAKCCGRIVGCREAGVTHVLAVHGFSRKIVGLITLPVKNAISIYHAIMRPLLISEGMWEQVRVDHGTEFCLLVAIQQYLANLQPHQNRHHRYPVMQSTSTDNHRVERLWMEVNQRVNYPILVALEANGRLDLSNVVVKFCVSYSTIKVLAEPLLLLVESWNNHRIPGTSGGIPNVLASSRNNITSLPMYHIPTTD